MGGEPIWQTWTDPPSPWAPRMLWAGRTGRELSFDHHTRTNVGFLDLLARHLILGSCQGYVDPNTPLAALMCHPAVVLNPSRTSWSLLTVAGFAGVVWMPRHVGSQACRPPSTRACHNFGERFARETGIGQFGAWRLCMSRTSQAAVVELPDPTTRVVSVFGIRVDRGV